MKSIDWLIQKRLTNESSFLMATVLCSIWRSRKS